MRRDRSEMSALPLGSGWLPITSAPRDGTRIEVFSPTVGIGVAWWLEGLGAWVEDIGSGYTPPCQDWTRWRPVEARE